MRRSRRTWMEGDWSSEITSGYALAAFLTVVLIGFTLLVDGPFASIDAYFKLEPPPRNWRPALEVVDRIGQRAVCLPILAVVLWRVCKRYGGWRPAWVAAIAVFSLNLVVLILKVGLGRGWPGAFDPAFFSQGMAYPSGHTANIVLVYGLIPYVLGRYAGVARRTVWSLAAGVVGLGVIMVVTSLTLDWHWFADLIAGLLVGGIVLELAATIDLHTAWRGPERLRDERLVRRRVRVL